MNVRSFATASAFGASIAFATVAHTQSSKELPLKYSGPPTVPAITAGDLMTRLYIFADDSMQGRRVGEMGHLRSTDYIARELARAGLRPAREGSDYFQIITTLKRANPSRNVIALLPGSDSVLRNQYIVIGAHSDHIGRPTYAVDHDAARAENIVLRPAGAESRPGTPTSAQLARIKVITDSLRALHERRRDTVYNGADDDGSGIVAVLEIAEALAASPQRPKRSILFVVHGGEELGMVGSTFFTDQPLVPRDSIVAELNLDVIGRGRATDQTGVDINGARLRGGPSYLQLVGSRRLSSELGQLVEQVNTDADFGFTFDYSQDAADHPQQRYCRSDHYAYARYGIPIVFFTTGGHADYHLVTDEPQYIDYEHMSRIAQLVEAIAVRVANLDHRVVVDKPLPPGAQKVCKQ